MAYKILEEKWRPEGVIRDILIDSTDDIPNLPAGSLPGSTVSTADLEYFARIGPDGELHQIGGGT